MRVSVIGCGHLGAPHAAAMADLGHEVIGVELDADKCKALAAGVAPFYEEGFDELLARHTASGRLRFTTSMTEAAEFADLHFLAVGTPLRRSGEGYDVSQIVGAVRTLLPLLRRPCTIVGKSTVTAGTAERLRKMIDGGSADGVELVWNPEFLREGHAIVDSLYPDRIVAGVTSPNGLKAVEEVYAPILSREDGTTELIVTDLQTAEVLKSSANAFLALKISFINAIAGVCDAVGGDVNTVAHALGIDPRIGHGGMRPGLGYGGGCLPKDIAAFVHRIGELGATDAHGLLSAVETVNAGRPAAAGRLVAAAHGGSLDGARIAVLGSAFKAGTSDVRDSPALRLVQEVVNQGAVPVVYDPYALEATRRLYPELAYAHTVEQAVRGADVTVIATEWPELTHNPKLPPLLAPLARARVLVDVRNAVDAGPWLAAGWTVHQVGRPAQTPEEPSQG